MGVADNLTSLQQEITTLCAENKRAAEDVALVAVSKKQPESRIDEALTAGHRLFGENRVQEAEAHWAARRNQYPDLRLHLIGPLQTNKAAQAVALFDVIETLDREKLAKTLAKEMDKQGRRLPCFIQVNTGEEEQKAGIAPADLEDFYQTCTRTYGLDVTGLMCIPPIDEPAALHFALLKKHTDALGVANLSMGMSSDWQLAIPLGATHIRVGTGVFGARAQ